MPDSDELSYDPDKITSFDELQWKKDLTWNCFLESMRRKAVDIGKLAEFEADYFGPTNIQRAAYWLGQKHRQIHAKMITRGEAIFDVTMSTHNETYLIHIIKRYDTSDAEHPVLVAVLVATELNKTWEGRRDLDVPNPGDMLDSQEMTVAKRVAYECVTVPEFRRSAAHAVAYVQVGSDMVACEARADIDEPKVVATDVNVSDEDLELSAKHYAQAEATKETGLFNWMDLEGTIEAAGIQGDMLWDEGEVSFTVNGKSYEYGSRVLSQRNDSMMRARKGFQATHFCVKSPSSKPGSLPSLLFRMLDAPIHPDGVSTLYMKVAIDPSLIWPRPGQFVGTPAFKAAEAAFLEKARQMNRQGIFRHSLLMLSMGVDIKTWSFIGRGLLSEETSDDVTMPASNTRPLGTTTLNGFGGLTLEEQPSHLMFDSGGNFHGGDAHFENAGFNSKEFQDKYGAQIRLTMAQRKLRDVYPSAVVSGDFGNILGMVSEAQGKLLLQYAKNGLFVMAQNDDGAAERPKIKCIMHSVPPLEGLLPEGTFGPHCPEVQEGLETLKVLTTVLLSHGCIDEEDYKVVFKISNDSFYSKLVDRSRLETCTADDLLLFSVLYRLYP